MNRRVAVGTVLVALVVLAGLAGYVAVNGDAGEPTYTPDSLAGYEQTENITGAEAEAIIAELHRQPSAVAGFEEAIVATYGGESREDAPITVYASVHGDEEEATENITRMVDAMEASPALDVENTTVERQTVYTVEGDGMVFAFFSYRDTAYWVTHSAGLDAETEALVSEIIETNRDSRQRFPIP